MLVSLKELMADANEKGYAVGAFNVSSLETLNAIVQAAEETQKPVILNWVEIHEPYLPMEQAALIMLDAAKKASVPMCVHLDHGSSMEMCMKAIRLGFTSVMLDASGEDYETNVKETAEIVRLAHSVGVTVEAEPGHIFASSFGVSETSVNKEFENAEDAYTDPQLAKDFVERTGVDVLAIAFGTTHGVYTTTPVLDLDRITKIKEAIDIPFVMHGGSGLSKEEFQTAVKNGIRKINFYTYMVLAGGKAIKEAMQEKGADELVFFHDLPKIATDAMKEEVKNAILTFSMEV